MQRLLFLCGSLEPGRDGVGDHVRLLAEACARLGHPCALLALNDSFVTASLASEEQIQSGPVPVLRLPSTLAWNERVKKARAFREKFAPDWISLHLVPYAFHPRGLLFALAEPFREIIGDSPLHLMFHEVWLGGGAPTPLRHRFTGFFQRRGIRRLLHRLKPQLITTSNPVYAGMLGGIGVEAGLLPLFGNVPILDADPWKFLREPLGHADITPENRDGWWIGLFFGALYEEWKPEPFLGLLCRAAKEAGKRPCLVLAGRAGVAGEALWQKMADAYGSEIVFLHIGKLPPDALSAWLREANFGVASSPWQLVGKSGTVAAMLDHGLPVIVTRDDFQPDLDEGRPPSADPLLHRLDESFGAKLAAGLPKRAPYHRADEIAVQLSTMMRTASP